MEQQRVDLERIKTLRAISIIIIGFATGALSGLLGIGGGIILVPAMVYLLGINQHAAHGTSLAVISFVVLLSALYYGSHGQVDWIIALWLAGGGVIGAAIGARLCSLLSGGRLRQYFAIFLMLVAVRMVYDLLDPNGAYLPGVEMPSAGVLGTLLILSIGVLTGVLSGLFGVGGGVIIVPAMVLLLGMSQHAAQGISLAVIIPVSVSGALIHFRYGNLRMEIWKWLTIGGVVGGLVGARIALGLDPLLLRGLFGVLLIVLAYMMFRRGRTRGTSDETCSS